MDKKNDEGHVNWMDQISKDYDLNEEMKKNPGFGKPLPKDIFKGDVYSNFLKTAKNAGYLPPWLNLQKEIRDEIALVLSRIDQSSIEPKIKSSIDEINVKILKYNGMCPPKMQRGRISLENIEKQYEQWE